MSSGMGCNSGNFVECYTGGIDTKDVGLCVAGVRTCTNGTWDVECAGEITPVTEGCSDNLDNDCDSFVDCDDPDCSEDIACNCEDNDQDGWGVGWACTGQQDCHDGDPSVHPGQESFFSDSYTDPVTGSQTFDYNCDGLEEKKRTLVVSGFELVEDFVGYWTCYTQTGTSPYCTALSEGWWPDVAECGDEGDYFYAFRVDNYIAFPADGSCNPPGSTCVYAYAVQTCR